MPVPGSTYRLQLGPSMTFERACMVLPNLARLGVTHVFLSPIMQATTGSTHGYDVTDPTRLREELGGEDGWELLVRAAQANGLGLVLDIVPNHMAATPENAWFRDVVEKRQDSPFSRIFDVDWEQSEGGPLLYRRFFDVWSLVGVRLEDPEVFRRTHERILATLASEAVDGVRIDHVDGLQDPLAYLRGLRRACGGKDLWFIVEKILEASESLPDDWPVEGTTGYEFLNDVTRLLVDGSGLERLDEAYRRHLEGSVDLAAVPLAQKRHVIDVMFSVEMKRLVGMLATRFPDVGPAALHGALRELTARLPVYRTYRRDGAPPTDVERHALEEAFAAAADEADPAALGALRTVLLEADDPDADREFVTRWQQFTPAVMGKGFEDTALYVDLRLGSLNEVGGDPRPAPSMLTTEAFHDALRRRARACPDTMNTTSTHDTKRSEDVRARLNVLSELPVAFEGAVRRWREWNHPFLREVGGTPCPDRNTEWLLYQTLLGAWPLDDAQLGSFHERLNGYLVKASREAKRHTSPLEPDRAWEAGMLAFVDDVLDPEKNARFREDLVTIVACIAPLGARNSLVQLALKMMAPGVPDLYQGCESWELSLVDPDNRRPVNFDGLAAQLVEVDALEERLGPVALLGELAATWRDGRLKLWLTHKLLTLRRENAELFRRGEYVPLEVRGARAGHVVAFARRQGGRQVVVVVGRRLVRLAGVPLDAEGFPGELPEPGALPWEDTCVVVAQAVRLKDVLTGRIAERSADGTLRVDRVLGPLPCAVLGDGVA